MRTQAGARLEAAVQAGRAAAEPLTADPALPYGYIAEALTDLAEDLSGTPLEAVSEALLEDCLFRLEGIALAADTDVLRFPAHRPLFAAIGTFQERLEEALEFFRQLELVPPRTEERTDRNLDFQEHTLLFYLKGEVQKMSPYLEQEQRAALDASCAQFSEALRLSPPEAGNVLQEVGRDLTAQAERLGARGAAIRFIAKEIQSAGESEK